MKEPLTQDKKKRKITNEMPGLKRLRGSRGKISETMCSNCKCYRYSDCGCEKKSKGK